MIIVGKNAEKSRLKAEKLFGRIFPEQELVIAQNRAVINAPSAVVIVEKNAAAEIKSALGIIADEDGCFRDFPQNTYKGAELFGDNGRKKRGEIAPESGEAVRADFP